MKAFTQKEMLNAPEHKRYNLLSEPRDQEPTEARLQQSEGKEISGMLGLKNINYRRRALSPFIVF